MKKLTTSQALITGFLGASLLAAIAASTYTVTVDSTGVIKYPLNFASANGFGAGGTNGNYYNLVVTNRITYLGGTTYYGTNQDWEISYFPDSIDFYSPGSDIVVAQMQTNGLVELNTLMVDNAATFKGTINIGTVSTMFESANNLHITSGSQITMDSPVVLGYGISGDGSGLTGIPSTAITGGFTTNLVIKNGIISTNTLAFVNGILVNVTSP